MKDIFLWEDIDEKVLKTIFDYKFEMDQKDLYLESINIEYEHNIYEYKIISDLNNLYSEIKNDIDIYESYIEGEYDKNELSIKNFIINFHIDLDSTIDYILKHLEINSDLRLESVVFENCIFTENISLCKYSKVNKMNINNNIYLYNCKIFGEVNFGNSLHYDYDMNEFKIIVNKEVKFHEVTFFKKVSFIDIKFNKILYFYSCEFKAIASFDKIYFVEKIYISSNIFYKYTSFLSTKIVFGDFFSNEFKERLHIFLSYISNICFYSNVFHDEVSFDNVNLKNKFIGYLEDDEILNKFPKDDPSIIELQTNLLCFKIVKEKEGLNNNDFFNESKESKTKLDKEREKIIRRYFQGISFENSIFKSKVTFKNITLTKNTNLDFSNTIFESVCEISFKEIYGTILFYKTTFMNKCYLDEEIIKLHKYKPFEHKQSNSKSKWSYFQASEIYKDNGKLISQLETYNLYKKFENQELYKDKKYISSFKYLFNYVFEKTTKHFTCPKRVFLSMLTTIAFFWVIYLLFPNHLSIGDNAYLGKYNFFEYAKIVKNYSPKFISSIAGNTLYFATITFTTIGYGDISPESWLKVVAAIEGFLGVFFSSSFLVALSKRYLG